MLSLVTVVTLTGLLTRQALEVGRSVDRVRSDLAVAVDHLDDVIAAGVVGESQLQSAASSTGAERSSYLAQSINSGELAARAWTRYVAVALPLDGEARLAARYERDYAAGTKIGGEVMIPIIRSGDPTPLPLSQLRAAERNRTDLVALRSLYLDEQHTTLTALAKRMATAATRVRWAAFLGILLALIAGTASLRAAFRLVADRRTRAEAADLAEFESQLIRALELADDEASAFQVTARALADVQPEAAVSVLVSDESRATFRPLVGSSPCGIRNLDACPAMRAGAPLQFRDSTSLDACPVLAGAGSSACSVTCMPVSIGGRDAALVQLSGPPGAPPEMGGAVRLVVRRAGDRVTLVRAVARFELQASRDPLTGLLNRRSLEAAVEALRSSGRSYAVAFADLDHFKRLNDLHGHEAGDRALRGFARTLERSLRPDDISCRWGGEEFIVVLPGCGETAAVEAMERVRSALATAATDRVDVTMSVGVAVEAAFEPFDQTVARADAALRQAKAAGRDAVVAWTPPRPEAAPASAV